jgi:hypothetical protein
VPIPDHRGGLWVSDDAGTSRSQARVVELGLCCSIALGMLFGGVAGVMFNSRATAHEVTGEAFGVRFTSGRSSSTTWFGVPQPRGEFDFSISGTHGSIANGEALHIVYQDESYAVLAVDGWMVRALDTATRITPIFFLRGSWWR